MSSALRLVRRSAFGNAALAAWAAWCFFSISILVAHGSGSELVLWYLCYLALEAVSLWISRNDTLAPGGAFTVVLFSAFGLNIPLFAAGYVPLIRIPDATLARCVVVVIVTHCAFLIGAYLPIGKGWLRWIAGNRSASRRASLLMFLVLAGLQFASAALRIRFSLGEAGVQPVIPFAGYIQFVLYNGNLVLAVWFLTRGIAQSWIHTILGLALLLGISIAPGDAGMAGWHNFRGDSRVGAVLVPVQDKTLPEGAPWAGCWC